MDYTRREIKTLLYNVLENDMSHTHYNICIKLFTDLKEELTEYEIFSLINSSRKRKYHIEFIIYVLKNIKNHDIKKYRATCVPGYDELNILDLIIYSDNIELFNRMKSMVSEMKINYRIGNYSMIEKWVPIFLSNNMIDINHEIMISYYSGIRVTYDILKLGLANGMNLPIIDFKYQTLQIFKRVVIQRIGMDNYGVDFLTFCKNNDIKINHKIKTEYKDMYEEFMDYDELGLI